MRERERITIRRSRGSVGCRRDLTSRRHASPLMIQREDSATNSNTVFCTPPHNTRSWGAVRAYWERIAELAKGSVKCLLDVAGGSLKTAKAETVAPEPLVESSLGLPRLSKTQGFFTNEPSVAIDPMLPGRGSTDGSLHMPPLPPDPYQSVLSESVAAVPGALPSGAGSTTTPAPQVVYNFYYMNSGSFNPAASPLVLSGQAHQPTFVVNSSTVSHGGGALLRQTIAQKRQRDREGKYEHTGANKLHKSRSDASLHVANVEVQNHLITNRRVEPNEIICAQNNTSNKKEFLDTAFQSATSRNDSVRDVMSIVKGGEMLPLKGTALNNGFARPGPPAVAFDDDGFASNAGSDDGDGEGDTTDSRAPTKPSFGTGVSGQASAFGAKDGTTFAKISFNLGAGSSAAPTDKPAVPSNPFSLGAGSSTAPADKPAVPSNPFSFGAGSSAAPADKPAVPSNPFSFGAGSSAAPTDKPAVPSNPFSLGAGSSAAPTDKPAVASNPFSLGAGSSTVAISGVKEATLPDASRSKVTSEAMPIVNNGFARPGPPAVAFDDDGFASNAGSDDGDGEGDTTDSRAPTKPSFGTGVSGQASAFGAKDGTTFAKISFNLGAGSSAAPTDKPAVPSNPFSLGAGSSTAPADKPAVPSNPFSFGAGSSAAPADKPAVPSNPFSFGAGSSAAPTDKPAVPSNPFSLGAGSSAAPTDKPAVASNPFSLGAGSSTVAISGVKEATLPDASRSKVTSEAMPIVNNGFARPGPPAVAFDDDGFASNAGSDDGDGEGDTTDSRAPTKPSFGTGVSGQASAFGAKDGTTFTKISFSLGAGSSAAPADKPAVPSNPFSLGAGSSTAPTDKPAVPSNPFSLGAGSSAAPADKPAVPSNPFSLGAGSSTAPADKPAVPSNPFSLGAGSSAAPADKPAVPSNPFSLGAGSSTAPADKPAVPSNPFSLGAGSSAAPADKPAVPSNPFSFGAGSSAAPTDKPAVASNPFSLGAGSSTVAISGVKEATLPDASRSKVTSEAMPIVNNGFARPGPPAVAFDDDGFASNAGSDDGDGEGDTTDSRAPTKPSFGTGVSGQASAFGAKDGTTFAKISFNLGAGSSAAPTDKPAVPSNPFSLGAGSSTAPADKPAVPSNPFSLGAGSSAVPADKPAVPSNPFSLGAGSSTAPADKPAVPSNPFSFGAGSSTAPADKPAVPSNPFSFGAGSSAAPADKPAVPSNPFSLGAGSSTAPADKPAVPSNPFSLGAGSSAAPADKPAVPSNPFSFGAGSSAAPADKPAVPSNPFSLGAGSSAAPADKPAVPSNPFSLGAGSSAAPADKPAVPSNPFSFGAGSSAAPTDKPAVPSNPFSLGAGSSAAPADKPAVPSNPFSLGAGSSAAPADKPAVPSNPFSLGAGSSIVPSSENFVDSKAVFNSFAFPGVLNSPSKNAFS